MAENIVTVAFRVIADTFQARRELAATGESAKQTAASVVTANSTLASTFDAAAKAQANFTQQARESNQRLSQLATTNGLTGEQFRALGAAAEAAGLKGSAGSIAYNAFYQSLKRAAETGNDPGWAALGINVTNAIKQPAAAFQQFLNQFAQLDQQKQGDLGQRLLGSNFDRVAPSLNGLRSNLTGFISESGAASTAASGVSSSLAGLAEAGAASATASAGAAGGMSLLGGAATIAAGLIGGLVVAVAAAAAGTLVLGNYLFGISQQAAEAGAKIQNLSDRTGASTGRVRALIAAAQETGLSFQQAYDVVSRSFDRYVSNLDKANETNGRTAQTFRQLGIDVKEGIKDVNPALDQAVKALSGITSATQFSAKAQELFGQRNEQIVLVLKRLGGPLAEAAARYERLTGVTEGSELASKSFIESQSRLSLATGGLVNVIGSRFLPLFQPLIDLFTETVIQVRLLITDGLIPMGSAIRNVGAGFDLMNAVVRSSPQLLNLVRAVIADATTTVLRFVVATAQASGALFRFVTGDFQGAFELGGKAVAETQRLVAGVTAETTKASAGFAAAVGQNFLAIGRERARISRETKETELKDTADSKKNAEDAFNNELRILQRREAELDRAGKAEIEQARRAFDARSISLAQFESVVLVTEDRISKAKQELFNQERDLIERNKKLLDKGERERLLEEIANRELATLDKLDAEQERIRAERRKRELDAEQRFIDLRLKASSEGDKQEIERLRTSAEQRIISHESAERQIAAIETEGFERRRRALGVQLQLAGANEEEIQRVQEAIALLNAEAGRASAEAQVRVSEGQAKDLSALRAFLVERNKIVAETTNLRLDLLKQEADAAKLTASQNPADRQAAIAAIQAQQRAEEVAAEVRHQANLQKIEDDRLVAESAAGTNPGLIEAAERASNDRRLAEDQRFTNERNAIRSQATTEQNAIDPSSNQSIFGVFDEGQSQIDAFGNAASSALAQVSDAAGNMRSILGGAFSQISSGLGSMLSAFILTGSAGPAAFKKLAAGVIASIASQSLVKAIFETAEGFAALARFDPLSATQHFAAAKFYAVVGAIAGGIGAGIGAAGGLGGDGGGAGGGASASSGQFDRNQQRQPEDSKFKTGDVTGKLGPDADSQDRGPFRLLLDLMREDQQLRQSEHQATRAELVRYATATEGLTSRLSSMSPGDVVTAGAEERPDSIANGVRESLKRDAGFTRDIAGNLQLA
jgi:hypothetical protein